MVYTFYKVIDCLHNFSINIRLLPTNYRHIALAPYFVDFHAKFKSQIFFTHEIYKLAFDVQFRHRYFPDDFFPCYAFL